LHDEEVRVIDIELDRLEEVLHRLLLRSMPIDEVFARPSEHNLARNADLRILLEADGRLLFIPIVKHYGDACFGDSRLAALIDEVLRLVSLLLFHACHMP
jgi:hypothetical protein